MFIFVDADVKFDQPQTEVVFDRDKLRSQRVDLRRAGQDLLTLLGGGYVNRFAFRTKLQGHSPDQTGRTPDAGPTHERLHHRIRATAGAAVDIRYVEEHRRATPAEEVPTAERRAYSGVIPPPVPLNQALRFLEDEARAILPPGFTIDYAGESRQLRTEGNTFLATFLLSAVLIYLGLAAQFESFRDPFIILASVPLALSGALLFSFLNLTTLNIYSQVGLITLVDWFPRRYSHRAVRQSPARTRHRQTRGNHEASGTGLRPILMTTAATVMGHFPLIIANGPGAAAQQHRHHARERHDHRSIFTLFVVPAIYMLVAEQHVVIPSAVPEQAKPSATAALRSAPRFTGVHEGANV